MNLKNNNDTKRPTLHRPFPEPKVQEPGVYVRFSNNVFGIKMRSCHKGEFNVSKDKDNNLWIHIYYQGKEVIKLVMYKNPYHLAESILKVNDPLKIIDDIKYYKSLGLMEGHDFTIGVKGALLKHRHRHLARE